MPYLAPTSGWGEEVSIGKTSVDHGRHGFDLDKLVCVAQHGHSHECARYTVLAESLSPRARWRMTSRPRSGFVVDSLFALSSATNIYFCDLNADEPHVQMRCRRSIRRGAGVLVSPVVSPDAKGAPETVPELEGPPLWKPIKC
jgi:hypothetical protein